MQAVLPEDREGGAAGGAAGRLPPPAGHGRRAGGGAAGLGRGAERWQPGRRSRSPSTARCRCGGRVPRGPRPATSRRPAARPGRLPAPDPCLLRLAELHNRLLQPDSPLRLQSPAGPAALGPRCPGPHPMRTEERLLLRAAEAAGLLRRSGAASPRPGGLGRLGGRRRRRLRRPQPDAVDSARTALFRQAAVEASTGSWPAPPARPGLPLARPACCAPKEASTVLPGEILVCGRLPPSRSARGPVRRGPGHRAGRAPELRGGAGRPGRHSLRLRRARRAGQPSGTATFCCWTASWGSPGSGRSAGLGLRRRRPPQRYQEIESTSRSAENSRLAATMATLTSLLGSTRLEAMFSRTEFCKGQEHRGPVLGPPGTPGRRTTRGTPCGWCAGARSSPARGRAPAAPAPA